MRKMQSTDTAARESQDGRDVFPARALLWIKARGAGAALPRGCRLRSGGFQVQAP